MRSPSENQTIIALMRRDVNRSYDDRTRKRPATTSEGASRLDAAVLDADQRQSLVCVRSLGRAGLRVGAFDVTPRTPASRSRWCSVQGLLPDYSIDPEAFVDAVLELVERYRPRVVIPAHDGTIEALRKRRGEIEQRTALALAPEKALAVAVDKSRTLEAARDLGIAVPKTVRVDDVRDLERAAKQVGLPIVIKAVTSWIQSAAAGERLTAQLAVDLTEARQVVERVLSGGGSVLLQEWVSGSREAVWILYAHGRVLARFAQVAHRMFPILGGSSIVRESIPLPRDVLEAAERLVISLGLDGYSEVEFRRDGRGRPLLMEINPRLSASVELAVRAGVDFPFLLYSWAAGHSVTGADNYRCGFRMRWFGGDVRWLRQTLRSQGRPDVMPTWRAVGTFIKDCFRPAAYDYLSATDPRPALVAVRGFFEQGIRELRTPKREPTPTKVRS
jgi:predicted ATP-grasp superfamily ATP-dependent carboligase